MRCPLILVICLTVLCQFLACKGHHTFLAARVDPKDISRVLVVHEQTSSNPTERQMSPSELKRFDGRVLWVDPSPSGLFVGVLVATRSFPPIISLHIIDETQQTIRKIDNVHRFAFSPDEEHIAVIRGEYYEGEPGFIPFSTELIGLYKAGLGSIKGLEKAVDIQWTHIEDKGQVLLAKVISEEIRVWAYIPNTLTLLPTNYLSTHFSPDGLYYYLTPSEALLANLCPPAQTYDPCIRIYARDAIHPRPALFNGSLRRLIGWVDSHSLLVADEKTHRYVVYDAQEQTLQSAGRAVDWSWHTRQGFIVQRRAQRPDYNQLGRASIKALTHPTNTSPP